MRVAMYYSNNDVRLRGDAQTPTARANSSSGS